MSDARWGPDRSGWRHDPTHRSYFDRHHAAGGVDKLAPGMMVFGDLVAVGQSQAERTDVRRLRTRTGKLAGNRHNVSLYSKLDEIDPAKIVISSRLSF